tara:strand:- start:88 stop:930 length:843 start_codon:yes stop_codon:yes gene_type:complete
MLITANALRRIVRKCLKEAPDGLYPMTADLIRADLDSNTLTHGIYGKKHYKKIKAIIDIIAGLSPAAPAIDIKDAINAYDKGDTSGFFMSMAGFIPGVGEAKKLKELVDANKVKEAAKLINNAKTAEKVSKAGIKIKKIIKGEDNIRNALKQVIKDDGSKYHIHRVNQPKYSDQVLTHGLGLRKNRSGSGFRATTHTNDASSSTIKQLRFSPLSLGKEGKITVIYELKPGETLEKIAKPFPKDAVNRESGHGKFVAHIPNEYLKAYVDYRGAEPTLNIIK